MPGLVPGIHVFSCSSKDVDGSRSMVKLTAALVGVQALIYPSVLFAGRIPAAEPLWGGQS